MNSLTYELTHTSLINCKQVYMKEKHILIIGAGGHGIVVADIIQQMAEAGENVAIRGFLDSNEAVHRHKIAGITVLGSDDLLSDYAEDQVVVAVGDITVRAGLAARVEDMGNRFFTAIHPSAVIAASAKIGEGCMICANAVVNPETVIGDHVIINTGATVDHHNTIGSFCHLGPGSHTGGSVRIGERTFAGIGATILPGIRIGNDCVIGAGSVVTKDIEEGKVAVGNPARQIKDRTRERRER